ncbi:cycloartenol-C-24-methyltransferase 1 isoform X1 [Iris pallida]|uniref:Cycloartenol-C-24-methyltransferase 1 isoform X1 n=1 Tax=Iris pallida TaxID=29817 RepID=A0AAX6EIN8_IRIPA|nr:cycloartenol-C-24-methyltransferase 1 isoform X1 [Iris pallida]
MSKTGALDLASGLGGKIKKQEVQSAVEQYEKYHVYHGGDEEARKTNYSDMVNKYYDLATSFYEFGWGESFHFAHSQLCPCRWQGESLRESIKRHEHFLALQLGLKSAMKVLDVGCGIGGPLREIARFSSTSITGLNNNEYQISRGEELNRIAGLSQTCNFVKADFMKMPFSDSTLMPYTQSKQLACSDAVGCYRRFTEVLKPGQCLAYEWCRTKQYDPKNQEHQKSKLKLNLVTVYQM